MFTKKSHSSGSGLGEWKCVVTDAKGTTHEKVISMKTAEEATLKNLKKQLGVKKGQCLLAWNDAAFAHIIVAHQKDFESLSSGVTLTIADKKQYVKAEEKIESLAAKAKVLKNENISEIVDMNRKDKKVLAFLQVVVQSGSNLPAMDMNGFSDPYAILQVSGLEEYTYKTATQFKTLNPVWNETCLLPITSKDSKLVIAVYDWDFGSSDDFIGFTTLPLEQLFDYKPHDFTLTLTQTKKQTTKMRGTVTVTVALKNKQEANRKLFGTALHDALVVGLEQYDVPPIVEHCLKELIKRGLGSEGIGRISGVAKDIEKYRQMIDSGQDVDLSSEESVHTICGLLKLYLRELPEPLLTNDLYKNFLDAARSDPNDVTKLQEYVDMLPKANKALLARLLVFFHKVDKNSTVNQMTADNIATVFAPNILWSRESRDDAMKLMADSQLVNTVISTMITHYHKINLNNNDFFMRSSSSVNIVDA